MVLKKIINRARKMCTAAYIVMKISVIMSCLSFTAALILCLVSGGLTVDSYSLYYMARELANLPFVILLLGIIASVCLEDVLAGKSDG
ncbi:MAG: hypothetical protein GX942_06635 [Papillibacter sp.]|jgi:hypothetical protein|nr:hypothetical protein [Papillibacter sp.]